MSSARTAAHGSKAIEEGEVAHGNGPFAVAVFDACIKAFLLNEVKNAF